MRSDVHPDNRTMFGELIGGRADVTITDAIEVELQTRRHKELCRTITARSRMPPRQCYCPAIFVGEGCRSMAAGGGCARRRAGKLRRAMADD